MGSIVNILYENSIKTIYYVFIHLLVCLCTVNDLLTVTKKSKYLFFTLIWWHQQQRDENLHNLVLFREGGDWTRTTCFSLLQWVTSWTLSEGHHWRFYKVSLHAHLNWAWEDDCNMSCLKQRSSNSKYLHQWVGRHVGGISRQNEAEP